MSKLSRLTVPLLAVLALAGCGGSSASTAVLGHPCSKHDEVMQCILPPAPAPKLLTQSASPVAQGVDFGWSCPVSSARNFGASYLSYDTSKNWTRSCVDQFHAAHKGTVAVFEAGASDATGGYGLGYSQAKLAAQQVAALGAGPHQPLPLAIDCDCAGSSLVSYFQGANHAEPGRIEAYGGYDQILYLYQHHLVGHANWQTYAWSGGRWLPASIAPLEQYLNSSSVDYDRAIAAYYGQWPYNAPNPPAPPAPRCYHKGWAQPRTAPNEALCNRVRAHDASLGVTVRHEDGYLAVSNRNIATLSSEIAKLKARRDADIGRHTIELRARNSAAGSLAADLKKYGFTG